jgi:hypothetical protein
MAATSSATMFSWWRRTMRAASDLLTPLPEPVVPWATLWLLVDEQLPGGVELPAVARQRPVRECGMTLYCSPARGTLAMVNVIE